MEVRMGAYAEVLTRLSALHRRLRSTNSNSLPWDRSLMGPRTDIQMPEAVSQPNLTWPPAPHLLRPARLAPTIIHQAQPKRRFLLGPSQSGVSLDRNIFDDLALMIPAGKCERKEVSKLIFCHSKGLNVDDSLLLEPTLFRCENILMAYQSEKNHHVSNLLLTLARGTSDRIQSLDLFKDDKSLALRFAKIHKKVSKEHERRQQNSNFCFTSTVNSPIYQHCTDRSISDAIDEILRMHKREILSTGHLVRFLAADSKMHPVLDLHGAPVKHARRLVADALMFIDGGSHISFRLVTGQKCLQFIMRSLLLRLHNQSAIKVAPLTHPHFLKNSQRGHCSVVRRQKEDDLMAKAVGLRTRG